MERLWDEVDISTTGRLRGPRGAEEVFVAAVASSACHSRQRPQDWARRRKRGGNWRRGEAVRQQDGDRESGQTDGVDGGRKAGPEE